MKVLIFVFCLVLTVNCMDGVVCPDNQTVCSTISQCCCVGRKKCTCCEDSESCCPDKVLGCCEKGYKCCAGFDLCCPSGDLCCGKNHCCNRSKKQSCCKYRLQAGGYGYQCCPFRASCIEFKGCVALGNEPATIS